MAIIFSQLAKPRIGLRRRQPCPTSAPTLLSINLDLAPKPTFPDPAFPHISYHPVRPASDTPAAHASSARHVCIVRKVTHFSIFLNLAILCH